MKYARFLQNRGSHFRRVAARIGDGVVCTTSFGAIGLTKHVWRLAENRYERKLVEDVGGFGVMYGHCSIEPLMEFLWEVDRWHELRLIVQYVTDICGRTFICVLRGSHAWFALARISKPGDALLLAEFLSSRRAHDREGYGFCASKGAPTRVFNYHPDLLGRQTVSETYGRWLRWAERMIGWPALHCRTWEDDVKHGVGKSKSEISSLRNSVEQHIIVPTASKVASVAKSASTVTAQALNSPGKNHRPMGISTLEAMHMYRDGFEKLANLRLSQLMKEEKLEEARSLLEKIIVVVGDKPASLATCQMKLGALGERLNDFELAERAYRTALVLEPTDMKEWYFAHNNLGFSLNQLERPDEAEVFCRQAIEIQPTWHHAHKNLGVALSAQGSFAEAAKQFVRATELCPRDGRALTLLEELLDEHEIVYLQWPDVQEELDNCRKLADSKERGSN